MFKFMGKLKNDYRKFQIRGAIKEIMRNYGLRTISLKNYKDFLNTELVTDNVHSVKYDIMNGYIKFHKYKENNDKCGDAFDTVSIETYQKIYSIILSILDNEQIPSKIKRNILVKVNR